MSCASLFNRLTKRAPSYQERCGPAVVRMNSCSNSQLLYRSDDPFQSPVQMTGALQKLEFSADTAMGT